MQEHHKKVTIKQESVSWVTMKIIATAVIPELVLVRFILTRVEM